MATIQIATSPDPGLAWLLYLLLAFLLVSCVVGAISGADVLGAGAPGPLAEAAQAEPGAEKAAGEKQRSK